MAQEGGPCLRGQRLLDNAPCQAVAGLDSGALLLPRYCASLVQTKADRHAKGSPFGGAGEEQGDETERARMLTANPRRCDSIALTKSLPIAAQRLFRAGLALSVIASQCHLSHRERLWQVGPLPTGRPRRNMAQKGGPCYRGQPLLDDAPCQAAAGLDSRALQSTKQISFARPEET